MTTADTESTRGLRGLGSPASMAHLVCLMALLIALAGCRSPTPQQVQEPGPSSEQDNQRVVRGRVVLPSDLDPLPRARSVQVSARSVLLDQWVETGIDLDGEFKLSIPASWKFIQMRVEGHNLHLPHAVILSASELSRLVMLRPESGTGTIRVSFGGTEQAREAWAGAMITLHRGSLWPVRAEASPDLEQDYTILGVVPGDGYMVHAAVEDGPVSAVRQIEVLPDQTTAVRLELWEGHDVAGLVVSANGTPVGEGMPVSLSVTTGRDSGRVRGRPAIGAVVALYTDDRGRFLARCIPVGKLHWSVGFQAEDGQDGVFDVVSGLKSSLVIRLEE